jgi:predicted GIY-YIG superfamily endonuclease
MAWVYILHADRRYYIGATENLERRLEVHKRGSNHTTRRFGFNLSLSQPKNCLQCPKRSFLSAS